MTKITTQQTVFPTVFALLCAMAVGSLLCILYGEPPLYLYKTILSKTWGDGYGIGQVIYKATMLSSCGLAVAIAFRAGLFNVGVEGQLLIGGFCAALLGAYLPVGTPFVIAVPLVLLAGAIGGAVWALPAALLRAYRGAHEVISTVMLNFLAALLINYGLTVGGFAMKESVHTKPIIESAGLSRFSEYSSLFAGSAANVSVFLIAFLLVAVWFFLQHTKYGYRLRAFGFSPGASVTYGISSRGAIVSAMAISGAIAGFGSSNFVLGYKGYFEENFSGGVGFMGIAVAIVAKNSPAYIPVAALLFATLSQGGLAINSRVPKDLIDILQAVIIIAVVAASEEVKRVFSAAKA